MPGTITGNQATGETLYTRPAEQGDACLQLNPTECAFPKIAEGKSWKATPRNNSYPGFWITAG